MARFVYVRPVATVAVGAISLGISGCIAAVPLLLAQGAALGLTGYKTVQLVSGGGTIKVGFPGKDGKDAPLVPLPSARKVAVWPGDEGDMMFAQSLSESGRFEVSSPAAVSGVLLNQKIGADLKTLTAQEQGNAFSAVCRETQSDIIFATRNFGAHGNENFLSLSRANVTYSGELIAFSCEQRSNVWTEQVAVVVELGGNSPPPAREINQAAAQAMADRVIQAVDLGTRQSIARDALMQAR